MPPIKKCSELSTFLFLTNITHNPRDISFWSKPVFKVNLFLNITYPARERSEIPKRDTHRPENVSSPVETVDLP